METAPRCFTFDQVFQNLRSHRDVYGDIDVLVVDGERKYVPASPEATSISTILDTWADQIKGEDEGVLLYKPFVIPTEGGILDVVTYDVVYHEATNRVHLLTKTLGEAFEQLADLFEKIGRNPTPLREMAKKQG